MRVLAGTLTLCKRLADGAQQTAPQMGGRPWSHQAALHCAAGPGISTRKSALVNLATPCNCTQWALSHSTATGAQVTVRVHAVRQPGLYRWPLQLSIVEPAIQSQIIEPGSWYCPVDMGWLEDQARRRLGLLFVFRCFSFRQRLLQQCATCGLEYFAYDTRPARDWFCCTRVAAASAH